MCKNVLKIVLYFFYYVNLKRDNNKILEIYSYVFIGFM